MRFLIIPEIEDFTKSLNKIYEGLEKSVDSSLNDISQQIVDDAKKTTVFKGNSPGGLRQNIKFINNGSLAKTVIADKDYAYYVEFGNNQKGPYIYPVKAKALRFYINGEVVFRKRVRSHGSMPFLRPAYEKIKPNINHIINTHIISMIKGSK